MKTIILLFLFIFYIFCAHDCQADGCINDDCGSGFRDMVCNITNESIFNCNVNAVVTSECLTGNCVYIQCISPFTPVTNIGLNQTCTLNTGELCCPGFDNKNYRICTGKNNTQSFFDEFKNITCSQYPCPVTTISISPIIPCPICNFCFLDSGLEYMIINNISGSINQSALPNDWCNNLPLQCGDSIINNTGLCITISTTGISTTGIITTGITTTGIFTTGLSPIPPLSIPSTLPVEPNIVPFIVAIVIVIVGILTLLLLFILANNQPINIEQEGLLL